MPDATRQGGQHGATEVAESVMDASKAIAAGRDESRKVDSLTLQTLKASVADGTYTVDAAALAERILDDAFGTDGP